jgi:glycerol kinase
VFDDRGTIRSVAQREFTQIFPKPGWVEHDPEEIAASQIAVALEALSQARAKPGDIAAIGITNQRETTVIWDRATGKPIYNAIVWQDRRTATFCQELKARGHENLIQQRTGLLIDAYFSASKISWILGQVPNARHGRHLVALEADRRPRTRHRRQQRLAHHAFQSSFRSLG